MMGDLALPSAESALAHRLFVPLERWGWEFIDGGPPVPSPLADQPPTWAQPDLPDLPDLPALVERRRRTIRATWIRLLLPAAFLAFGTALATSGGLLFVPAGGALALLAGSAPLARHAQLARARSRTITLTAKARAAHEQAVADWRASVAAHNAAETRRRSANSAFYPVTSPAATPRVDVFGGDGNGWASLLATAGGSVLGGGTGMLLVDLSERTVGGGLARLAGQARCPVESWDLPRQLDEVGLLDGLVPREAAELVADAFAPGRENEPDHHRRALHADLLNAVVEVLGSWLTFRRLTEGLRVLEGLDDGRAATTLTPAEARAIVGRMNAFGRGDRVADELRYLRSSLEALCPPTPGQVASADTAGWPTGPGGHDPGARPRQLSAWWPVRGLRVLATSSRGSAPHLKELADRLAVQAVFHQLRHRPTIPGASHDMLVVAGADHLGRAVLIRLSRHAEIAGVRLVLLFERLADDSERLLGEQGGSTIIMRLGNGKDATTAAEFIGRGHRFVLSQVTAQIGRSFTVGDSDSIGSQDGVSDTTGTSGGTGRTYDRTRILPWLQNTSTNTGWQESVTTSRSQTWQRTVNASLSDSTTDGETSQRVYEFLVEPTTVQTLPTTAFLLVSAIDGPDRVTLGDCNPGTVLLPRVSPVDRWTAARTAAGLAPPVPMAPPAAWPAAWADDHPPQAVEFAPPPPPLPEPPTRTLLDDLVHLPASPTAAPPPPPRRAPQPPTPRAPPFAVPPAAALP
ncbi:hypothetical protein, partial [Frankia sp. AgKG'84/4]|uniref:hypothetical protein n=1 Tax=Frankia sp. AgKG'84/4 TaxID=573490 RepID=UPI002029BB23